MDLGQFELINKNIPYKKMMMNLYNYFSINIMILNNNFFNSLILKNFLDNKINLIFSHWMSRYILDLKKNIENNFFIKLLELFKSKNFIFKII